MKLLNQNRLNTSAVLIIMGLTIAGIVQCTQLAGTVDETDTGRLAMLYNSDGSPAAQATIRAYQYRDTTLVYETKTALDGSYSLSALSGTYAIWAEKDSFVAFQDSVIIQKSNRNIANDTLKRPGSILGRIELQIGDPYTAVTVNALGTYAYANVSDSGWFTLDGLAEGNYTLQLSTSLSGYAATYTVPISVRSGQQTVVTRPFSLIYTGIPYVTGLRGEYDTLNGVIRLTWDLTSYPHFQDYLVFRRSGSQGVESFVLHAITHEALYSEAIDGQRGTTLGAYYQYKVVIRDRFENHGRAYGHIEVQTCPVESILTYISYNAQCMVQTLIDKEVAIVVAVRNPTRNLRRVVWNDLTTQEILRERNLSGTVLQFRDTLRFTPKQHGATYITTTVIDAGGSLTSDSILVSCKPAYAMLSCKDTLSGVFALKIAAGEAFSAMTITLGNRLVAEVPVVNGFALCSLDTRTIYPPQSARMIISSGPEFRDTSWVLVSNPDPLIGCWLGEKDTLIRECYFDNGRIQSNREYAWLMGWERRGERVALLQATSTDVVFAPYFIDYYRCILNGMTFVRDTH